MRLDIRYYTANHIADVQIYQYVFCQKTSIGGVSFQSRKPKPNDECGEPETDENDEKTRQHNFKHCAYHRTLFFSRDVAFLAFMSGRVFPILKSGAPVFWQFVAVHGSYSHTVVPVVLSVFSAHTVIIACIPCKINRFFCIARLINRILSFHDVFMSNTRFAPQKRRNLHITAQFAVDFTVLCAFLK